jgi:hypothetical protein
MLHGPHRLHVAADTYIYIYIDDYNHIHTHIHIHIYIYISCCMGRTVSMLQRIAVSAADSRSESPPVPCTCACARACAREYGPPPRVPSRHCPRKPAWCRRVRGRVPQCIHSRVRERAKAPARALRCRTHRGNGSAGSEWGMAGRAWGRGVGGGGGPRSGACQARPVCRVRTCVARHAAAPHGVLPRCTACCNAARLVATLHGLLQRCTARRSAARLVASAYASVAACESSTPSIRLSTCAELHSASASTRAHSRTQ